MVLPLVPVMPTMRSCEEGQLKNRSAMRPTTLCKSTTDALNTAGARTGASTPGAGSHSTALAPRAAASAANATP